ncbi:MAG: hypothetical protein Unbinned838contig1000_51 [Prokaryotic dsDNA virus sp.]|nr:MAG: hypothetical protein Unbinned838contig1000_51 [Prokaryotic dsDNA virus sp.]|tara:strand:- start:54282 stop:54443 length:162 start_codon:yes stop_codon:yes gene_type:complete
MKKIIVIWPRLKKAMKEVHPAELGVFLGFTGIIFTGLAVVAYSLVINLINLLS